MSKQQLRVWPVRAYDVDSSTGAQGLVRASLTGNSKQRRRGRRILQRAGYSLIHDGGACRVIAMPK